MTPTVIGYKNMNHFIVVFGSLHFSLVPFQSTLRPFQDTNLHDLSTSMVYQVLSIHKTQDMGHFLKPAYRYLKLALEFDNTKHR